MAYTYEYPRPAFTTDALLVCNENNNWVILLIERGNEPFRGYWALPGGFVDINEDLLPACKRELEEETLIKGVELQQFQTFGKPNRDPRGWTVSTVFWAKVENKLQAIGSDDASKAKWFDIEKLPAMAFDHLEIIEKFKDEVLS